MKTAIIQHAIQWGQPAANLQELSKLMNQQQGSDLFVLSETFATGFMTEGALADGNTILHATVCSSLGLTAPTTTTTNTTCSAWPARQTPT